jgi:hypothetical protein
MNKDQREKIWLILHEMHVKHDVETGLSLISGIIDDIVEEAVEAHAEAHYTLRID